MNMLFRTHAVLPHFSRGPLTFPTRNQAVSLLCLWVVTTTDRWDKLEAKLPWNRRTSRRWRNRRELGDSGSLCHGSNPCEAGSSFQWIRKRGVNKADDIVLVSISDTSNDHLEIMLRVIDLPALVPFSTCVSTQTQKENWYARSRRPGGTGLKYLFGDSPARFEVIFTRASLRISTWSLPGTQARGYARWPV